MKPKQNYSKPWETGDTCPGCGYDGMTFTPDAEHEQIELDHGIRGTLTCPSCGWFDEMALATADMIPEEAGR
jgi:hypothetical protein